MSFIESALRVIDIEHSAIGALKSCINQQFTQACEAILNCKGRVVILGIGKSGHIGNKIAATLASTGTPAFAVNAGEASHGDFGMITAEDVVIAISNSGHTAEVVKLIPLLKRLGVTLISLTGKQDSELAAAADIQLDASINQEACPLGLAPTTSTTVTLVMGDALAIALLEARNFTADQFAFAHPGGSLGKRLLLTVADVMHTGDRTPMVSADTSLRNTIIEMTSKRLGMTTVVDKDKHLLGIYTDGDIRRTFDRVTTIKDVKIADLMTTNPRTITPNEMAVKAMEQMEQLKITSLVVVNNKTVIGVIHMHDLLQAGVA